MFENPWDTQVNVELNAEWNSSHVEPQAPGGSTRICPGQLGSGCQAWEWEVLIWHRKPPPDPPPPRPDPPPFRCPRPFHHPPGLRSALFHYLPPLAVAHSNLPLKGGIRPVGASVLPKPTPVWVRRCFAACSRHWGADPSSRERSDRSADW